jgi:hypothetical protein
MEIKDDYKSNCHIIYILETTRLALISFIVIYVECT